MPCQSQKEAVPEEVVGVYNHDDIRGLNLQGWSQDRYVSPDRDASWPAVAHTTIRPRLSVTLESTDDYGFVIGTPNPFNPLV
jgi:hypothetical protein